MSEPRAQPVLQQVAKPLNLIPVGLKEAALDSPTFRATAVHVADQVEVIEKWLEGYVKSTGKLINDVSALEELVNNHLARSMPPPTISEAVLDHDYTLLAMKRYSEGTREFWSHTISGMRKMDSLLVEPIRTFLQGELRNFKDSRRFLEQTQRSFDNLLSRYAAQSKTKEPSSLREDAFQLHEARKLYIKASMDFCVLAPQLRSTLDKLLVRICSDQWHEMSRSSDGFLGGFGKSLDEMDRIRSWSAEIEAGEKTFRRELQTARKGLEEKAAASSRPSRELDEYSTSTVPYLGSKGPSSMNLPSPARPGPERAEKQGWLFIRTLTGKPTRTVWTRRWFFVKRGIFGWLVQGARTGGVEESERIGVLLCNVKPAFQEERRFCFEVKTKDNTILLQCETQPELMDWLESFETAKRKAVEDTSDVDSPTSGVHGKDAAFAINPPTAPEFAAKTQDGHGSHGSDELSTGGFDRTTTLPIPEREGTNLVNRASFDISGRKSTSGDREGDGPRDHAARIIQKLDLHRKSNTNNLSSGGPTDGAPSAGLGPSGGIASLISASHNILPVYSGGPTSTTNSTPTAAPTAPKPDFTIANIASSVPLGQVGRDAPPSTLAPSTLANPPASTNLSKTAVLVSGERGMGVGRSDVTGGMPSGMMANLWGSSNWGYINRLERGELKQSQDLKTPYPASPGRRPTDSSVQSQASDSAIKDSDSVIREESETTVASSQSPSPVRHRNSTSLDVSAGKLKTPTSPATFPWNYPLQLKSQEAQFRMIFPNARTEDKLLLVFRASWNPNDLQEFPGRVYVTARDIYFYSHHLGLVLTSGISLESVEEVTAAPGKDYDFLFLHLKEASSEAGYTRITVKVFLEPLRLLQRRLNFLIRNIEAGHDLSLEATLSKLINMEKEDPTDSPSLQSWEDVPINTPADDGSALGRRTERDLRTTLQISGGLFDEPVRPDEGRPTTKFKLPAQPVVYEPKGFARIAVNRHIDISPKALFHVMFGDKKIKQGPWTQLAEGRMGRAFEYQIDHVNWFGRSTQYVSDGSSDSRAGRSRVAEVADNQVIDVLNDHLCYVVTDKKTPWHLPHHEDFVLVSEIAITHVAKSKCQLAIYTKVEWSKVPTFSRGLVEKQALDDLQLDALDLADVIADQVRRLGPRSRTKKAITIFGYVGQQTQASQVMTGDATTLKNNARRLPIRQRTLTSMMLETSGSVAGSAVSSLMIWSYALVREIWKISSAHSMILIFLALSLLTNVFYTSRDTSEWWSERNAGRFMARIGVGPNTMMGKAIYLHDLHEIATNHSDVASGSQSQCYSTFRSLTSATDLSAPASSAGGSVSTPSARSTARRLRRTRQRLGAYRHDLLVAMRIVNAVERESLAIEWESWLLDEFRRCKQVGNRLDLGLMESAEPGADQGALSGRDRSTVAAWYGSYCHSCAAEMEISFGQSTASSL
ncbi:MAG: SNF1-interacting protein [Thelocarpon impressellum]|nr:MAG: SNF1-interacting protein [Thelocarpon impressellum]